MDVEPGWAGRLLPYGFCALVQALQNMWSHLRTQGSQHANCTLAKLHSLPLSGSLPRLRLPACTVAKAVFVSQGYRK